MSSEADVRLLERRGNWKRIICGLWGHENIGTLDLLYRTPATTCLRCRASASVAPEWMQRLMPVDSKAKETPK